MIAWVLVLLTFAHGDVAGIALAPADDGTTRTFATRDDCVKDALRFSAWLTAHPDKLAAGEQMRAACVPLAAAGRGTTA